MIDCAPQLHIAAIHVAPGYNTSVPGLALLCLRDDFILSAGMFQNSIGHQSDYAIAGKYLATWGNVRFGLVAGAINGYPLNDYNFIPMAAAVVSVPWGQSILHFTIIPEVPNVSPALVQLSVSFKGLF